MVLVTMLSLPWEVGLTGHSQQPRLFSCFVNFLMVMSRGRRGTNRRAVPVVNLVGT